MNLDLFVRQIETMYGRLTELYQGASAPSVQIPQMMPGVFKELGTASEKLQLAAVELLQQNEELIDSKTLLEAERQRYLELFEFAPDAYLVTDTEGIIQEANRAATVLLNIPQHYLIGKPLAVFVPEAERLHFRRELNLLKGRDRVLEWGIRLQPRNGEVFDAALTLGSVRNCEGQVVGLRVCVRDITERKRAEAALENNDYNPIDDRPVHTYAKGEMIPLIPQTIWLVCEGLVKLSTLADNGEEVIVGFAGHSTPFGSSMTSLQVYQATALSDVQLVCIAIAELGMSPRLTEILLPKINQRLRQTEFLLAIAGQGRVKDRLSRLLLLLKQEIGQLQAGETRLSVRLTHEELAAACCTTRVTITRELNKLLQEGKIALDSDRHIILKNGAFS
ncbi:PAS domain S-box protein [Phormidium nigroviride]